MREGVSDILDAQDSKHQANTLGRGFLALEGHHRDGVWQDRHVELASEDQLAAHQTLGRDHNLARYDVQGGEEAINVGTEGLT